MNSINEELVLILQSFQEICGLMRKDTNIVIKAEKLMQNLARATTIINDTLINLRQSIEQVREDGMKTFVVVENIDIIAFQASLLALNAVRREEVWAGFEVVAHEIRSLAQNSYNVSKAAQDILKCNIENIEKSVALTVRSCETVSSFQEMVLQSAKELETIALSSQEEPNTAGIKR